jgi:hypothetical protein
MSIEIRRVGDRYEASVRPPHGGGRSWDTPRPLVLDELIDRLLARGCHQTDIGDALFVADPEWEFRDRPPAEDE